VIDELPFKVVIPGQVDMGESKAKKRAHNAILAACRRCIYCGSPATTIDHVPPRIMFRDRQRPKGLEFPSWQPCNEGTRLADLVAALIGRFYPDAEQDADQQEVKRLFSSVKNNIPGLLEEMDIGAAGQEQARKRLPNQIEGAFLRVKGPLVSMHMQTFATKLGFALYYEATKQIVPQTGGVAARWFSNVERFEGKFPDLAFTYLLPSQTLKQGKFEVSDQFGYQWRMAEGNRIGLFFAYFRLSFAVFAVVANNKSLLEVETAHPMRIVRPGEITTLLRPATA
jgi:hypothetical protein